MSKIELDDASFNKPEGMQGYDKEKLEEGIRKWYRKLVIYPDGRMA